MPYGRFLSANVVGALTWAVGLTVLGYLAASTPVLKQVSFAVAAVFVLGSLVLGVVGWVRVGERPGSSVEMWVDTRCQAPGPPSRTGASGCGALSRPSSWCWWRLLPRPVVGGGDDEVGTAAPPSRSPSVTSPAPTGSASGTAPATPASSPASSAASASPSASPSPTTRPPTLAFTVRYPAYITVRVPGGRTLVSKTFKSGAKASFDQKVLQVVNGRPQAVHLRRQRQAAQTRAGGPDRDVHGAADLTRPPQDVPSSRR